MVDFWGSVWGSGQRNGTGTSQKKKILLKEKEVNGPRIQNQGLFRSMLGSSSGILTGLSNKLGAALNLQSDESENEDEAHKVVVGHDGQHPKRHPASTNRRSETILSSESDEMSLGSCSRRPRPKSRCHHRHRQPHKAVTTGERRRSSGPRRSVDVASSESASEVDFAGEVDSSSDGDILSVTGTGTDVDGSTSESSIRSWASSLSNDSQSDEINVEAMRFMKKFVNGLFAGSTSVVSPEDKAKFGELCQHEVGRLWFIRYVNTQRVNHQRVTEWTFYRLVQHFAIALFECANADDYATAKSLMNMCFTFYQEIPGLGGESRKEFLYVHLREQPLWQSIRFWNAAFFEAVQTERAQRPIATRKDLERYSPEEMSDENSFQENITFGQLGTFACSMHAFGLSREMCYEFLRKQSTIANLRREQVALLRETVDSMYRDTSSTRRS